MQRPPKPTLVPFLAAGFNFASGRRILEVPYDAHSAYLFDGEETSLAVRAWTHGHDFYHPEQRYCIAPLHPDRVVAAGPVFWTQDWGQRARVQFWTMLRINWLLGLHDLLDYWVNATLLDTRDATVTPRHAPPRRGLLVVCGRHPDRDGVEWSPGRCKVFSTTGLPAFPRRRAGLARTTIQNTRELSVRGDGRGDCGRQLRVFCVNSAPCFLC